MIACDPGNILEYGITLIDDAGMEHDLHVDYCEDGWYRTLSFVTEEDGLTVHYPVGPFPYLEDLLADTCEALDSPCMSLQLEAWFSGLLAEAPRAR